jgi:hypothetical protein
MAVSVRMICAFRAVIRQEPNEVHAIGRTSGKVNPSCPEASIHPEDDAFGKARAPLLSYKWMDLTRRVHANSNQIRPKLISNRCREARRQLAGQGERFRYFGFVCLQLSAKLHYTRVSAGENLLRRGSDLEQFEG